MAAGAEPSQKKLNKLRSFQLKMKSALRRKKAGHLLEGWSGSRLSFSENKSIEKKNNSCCLGKDEVQQELSYYSARPILKKKVIEKRFLELIKLKKKSSFA